VQGVLRGVPERAAKTQTWINEEVGMDRDDVIRMAREADLIRVVAKHDDGTVTAEIPNILNMERFAALVAAKEREACAKVCDEKVDAEYATGKVDHNEMGWTQSCAIAIRMRANQDPSNS
jgi:hypothetical protein